ncbi:hypothetical protein NL108_017654 [Boleophthalmus pectinirostris]|nr:hypothetical protein NL108_017654 [Boleophthalmus pectinirostris]
MTGGKDDYGPEAGWGLTHTQTHTQTHKNTQTLTHPNTHRHTQTRSCSMVQTYFTLHKFPFEKPEKVVYKMLDSIIHVLLHKSSFFFTLHSPQFLQIHLNVPPFASKIQKESGKAEPTLQFRPIFKAHMTP